jgi:hypothetical protein
MGQNHRLQNRAASPGGPDEPAPVTVGGDP